MSPSIVTVMQVIAGLLWLVPAIYLTPRIVRSWKADANSLPIRGIPVGFLAWLQVGFTVRWLAWPHALGTMKTAELLTWATLYAFSGFLAVWFFVRARQTKDT